ncbi:DUF1207 domain-containing protein [Desulfobacterium sp. N47]|uniref:Uncharacterized protein n=1 Tax=uncultured Desulfobacterium sp. TaxID=201089 RepID=E1YBF0_9BACT|nr:hypothetical protein N47_G32180 [uncultured Desulfobacterium sp.]
MLLHITSCLNVTGLLCAASLCIMLLFQSLPAVAADGTGDEFLTGYIASILRPYQRGLYHWHSRNLPAWRQFASLPHLSSELAHWGIEYLGSKPLLWNGRPIGGVDMKSLEENNRAIDTRVKAGLEFGHPNPGQRRLRLMAEWYNGFGPHGQFYNNKVEYFGLGVSLGF